VVIWFFTLLVSNKLTVSYLMLTSLIAWCLYWWKHRYFTALLAAMVLVLLMALLLVIN
jgi:hypothetical protein